MLSGCFGGPDIKTTRVMDNFKEETKDRVVVDRNYQVGQRYRVLPGQVMIRNKLYTMTAEGAGAYRAGYNLAMVGDGVRLDIAEGTAFRVSDRILVNGKLANMIPLGAPPANAPDIQAIFANDNGTLVPAVLRAGKVAPFKVFEVQPKTAQLLPVTQESVKTSAGYVNYDLVYNSNAKGPAPGCVPAPNPCPDILQLDLTLMQYDPASPDTVARATRNYYPVRNNLLEVPGLKVTIHEASAASVVYEVTKDDNAYKKTDPKFK